MKHPSISPPYTPSSFDNDGDDDDKEEENNDDNIGKEESGSINKSRSEEHITSIDVQPPPPHILLYIEAATVPIDERWGYLRIHKAYNEGI